MDVELHESNPVWNYKSELLTNTRTKMKVGTKRLRTMQY